MSDICRFCLCRDRERLCSASNFINDDLTSLGVERFTGIQFGEEDSTLYAVCFPCGNKLQSASAFCKMCMENDVLFRQCMMVLKERATNVSVDIEEALGHDSLDIDYDNEYITLSNDENHKSEPTEMSYDMHSPNDIDENECSNSTGGYLFDHIYSANFIESEENSVAGKDESSRASKRRLKERREDCCPDINGSENEMESASLPSIDNPSDLIPNSSYTSIIQYPEKKLCDKCGKLITDMLRHNRSHTKEPKYSCSHCGIKMTDKGNLMRHVKSVHLKKAVKTCEICDKTFTSIASHVSHMRSKHKIGETFNCKVCLKTFNHRSGLRDHFVRLHNNEKKFECATCGSLWKTRRGLKRHEKSHSSYQPFPCSFCPKRFKTHYGRKTHEVTHSGIVFRCQHCDKSYRYKALLSIHLRKFHQDVDADQQETS